MAGIKPNEFNSITPTGTTEVYTQTGGVNGKFTLDDVKDYVRPYKSYVALLEQVGGLNPPVATVIENTLGGEVVWTQNGFNTGSYIATLVGAFTSGKTIVNTSEPQTVFAYLEGAGRVLNSVIMATYIGSEDEIYLYVHNGTDTIDGSLTGLDGLNSWIEIRVYL